MRLTWTTKAACLLASFGFLVCGTMTQAEVIFHDNFPARLAEGEIANSTPDPITTGAQYAYQVQSSVTAKIEGSGIGQILYLNTGYGLDSVYLPHAVDMTESTDILRLSLTFRKPEGPYDNFAFGFAGTGSSGIAGGPFLLLQANGNVQAWVPGTNTHAQSSNLSQWGTPIDSTALNTFVVEYDPVKIDAQPWSLTINGERNELAKHASTTYNALTEIGGIAFGNFNSGLSGTRVTWLTEMKFEIIPQPELEGDLDGDGFVGQSDLNLILGNWGQSVPPADPLADPDGSGSVGQGDLNQVLSGWGQGTPPNVEAVPEPATWLLFGLAGVGVLAARRVRRAA